MINIVCGVNPNYNNENRINTIKRKIDIVSQFIVLYKSIKKNWTNFEYEISIMHNIDFNETDSERLSKLDVHIYKVKPDYERLPVHSRVSCFQKKLKNEGTHRLVLDIDTIALSNPVFDLDADWQAMYEGGVGLKQKEIDYIIKKLNYKPVESAGLQRDKLFIKYIQNPNAYESFYPYFNGGVILMKEELCHKYGEIFLPAYCLAFQEEWGFPVGDFTRHIAIQYAASYALLTLSDNWKPFCPGMNYLLKGYDTNKFGKKNIQLLHYCGVDAEDIAKREFKEYFADI